MCDLKITLHNFVLYVNSKLGLQERNAYWSTEINVINFQEARSAATKDIACWESDFKCPSHQEPPKYPTMHVSLLWLTYDCIFQPSVPHKDTISIRQCWHFWEDTALLSWKPHRYTFKICGKEYLVKSSQKPTPTDFHITNTITNFLRQYHHVETIKNVEIT